MLLKQKNFQYLQALLNLLSKVVLCCLCRSFCYVLKTVVLDHYANFVNSILLFDLLCITLFIIDLELFFCIYFMYASLLFENLKQHTCVIRARQHADSCVKITHLDNNTCADLTYFTK